MSEDSAISRWVHACTRCGTCKYIFRDYRPSCPSGEFFRLETYYASGRIAIARGIERGELSWNEPLLRPVFACTTCGSCEEQCLAPHNSDIVEIIEELRQRAVEALGPLPAHAAFARNIQLHHNPYGAEHHNRKLVVEAGLPTTAAVVYFVGCTANYRETEIRDATVRVLRNLGVDFTVVNEYCCGSPLLRTGQADLAHKVAEHNSQVIEQAGARTVVVSCAGCYKTLHNDYPRLGVNLSAEVVHITEFLAERLAYMQQVSDSFLVTYHDPCHLGRHSGVYEAPRAVLESIGLETIEMGRSRSRAWCCGAGGGVKSAFPELAVWAAEQRVDEATSTGADILVSACPFCKRNLRDAETTNSIRVRDIVELVAERM